MPAPVCAVRSALARASDSVFVCLLACLLACLQDVDGATHDCVAEVYAPSPRAADLTSLRGVDVQFAPAAAEMSQERRTELAKWLPLVETYASAVRPVPVQM